MINTDKKAILDKIFSERPGFHKGETEIKGVFCNDESYLDQNVKNLLKKNINDCYGIDKEVGEFIYDTLSPKTKSLETGAGISTLVFALKGSRHTTITPNKHESIRINKYAKKNGIDINTVTFINEESNIFLPNSTVSNLDMVLIDGKHAFPWPIIDWFYTSDKLKKGGFMIIDDIQMASISILREYMHEDPRWKEISNFNHKTVVFEKLSHSINNVAWHMQPYIIHRMKKDKYYRRIIRKAKSVLKKKFYFS